MLTKDLNSDSTYFLRVPQFKIPLSLPEREHTIIDSHSLISINQLTIE